MTSSTSFVYLGKYYMINERNLMTISSNILHNSVRSKEFELHGTTLRPTTKHQTETMNQTIINMLKTLGERNKSSWKDHIQKLVHVYKCMTHYSTSYLPYYLLFGRTPKLPINLIIPSPADDHEQITHSSYISKWKEQLTQAYEIANKQSMQRKSKHVERKNAKRLRASILLPGDRVLV